MEIIKVTNKDYLQFIVESQLKMAQETENFSLNSERVSLGVAKVIDDPLKGSYFICIKDGQPVACLLTLPEWSDWRCKTVLWVHSVYVSESYRRQGIYKSMYQYLKRLVQDSDQFAGIRLYVDKTNHSALDVYHKLGMRSDHYSLCEWMK